MKDYPYISINETTYYGHSNWYFISYPAYGFSTIKRIITSRNNYKIYDFSIAHTVVLRTCFWPINNFNYFMNRIKVQKLDVETVFSGRKPPITEYDLDELLNKYHSYKKICGIIKERTHYPVRFNPFSFCGRDSQAIEADINYEPYFSLAKYLEPPESIKNSRAEYQLKEAIKQLGKNKCLEILL